MAIRQIRTEGDPILNKTSREVKALTDRNLDLIKDMLDTMYDSNGVGLAAPQVGILKRIFVVDVSDDGDFFVCINPEITIIGEETQTGEEGCLSVPGKAGIVTRPMKVHVKALDENMEEFEVDCEGLLARAMCHENDHLNGHLYTEIVEGDIQSVM